MPTANWSTFAYRKCNAKLFIAPASWWITSKKRERPRSISGLTSDNFFLKKKKHAYLMCLCISPWNYSRYKHADAHTQRMKVERDSPFYFVEHRKMFKNECYYVLITNLHFEIYKPVFELFRENIKSYFLGFITYRAQGNKKKQIRIRMTWMQRYKHKFNLNSLFNFGDEMCRQDREDRLLLPNIFTLKMNIRCTYHVQRKHKKGRWCAILL